jgi:hypothetical protein
MSATQFHTQTKQQADKCFPIPTVWRLLRFLMEEQPSTWRVAANTLNKQSRTADKGWYSSLGDWASY